MKCTSNLARILQERGITGAQLCRMVGCNPKNFATLIRGERLPQHDTAENVAGALKLTVREIWPNYDAELSERRTRMTTRMREWHAEHHGDADYYPARPRPKNRKKNAAWPSQQHEYKRERQVDAELRKTRAILAADPPETAPNAVPVPREMHANPLRLEPVHVDDQMLQDTRYCRAQAARIAKWLYDHMAYGVYRELRELMARENRMFEERAAAVAARGREEASL